MKRELIRVGHTGHLELQALHLQQAGDKAHPAAQAVQLGHQQGGAGLLCMGDRRGQLGAGIIGAALHLGVAGDL